MTTPASPVGWADFPGPTHQDALMDGYRAVPSIAEQDATHGAPAPQPDHGTTDQAKYGGAC